MSAADTYDEAENLAPQILAVSYTILSIVILSIVGRFYSRRHLLRAIHIEDWLALLACVHLTIYVILHTFMTTLKFGHHTSAIPASNLKKLFLLSACSRLLYPPTIALIRISVLLFMRRLCPHVCVHIAVAVLVILNILFSIISVLLMVFRCYPIAFFSSNEIGSQGTKCLVDDSTVALAIPITSTSIHVLMYFVPVFTVLRVSFLGWGQKAAAVGLFTAGHVATMLSLYRLPAVKRLHNGVDPMWNAASVAQWTVYETGVSIILASTPALWALLSNTMKKCGYWSTAEYEPKSPGSPGTDWEGASSRFPTRPVSMVTVPLGARRTPRDSYEELFLGTGVDAEEPRGSGRV